jgi:hypothetical protein
VGETSLQLAVAAGLPSTQLLHPLLVGWAYSSSTPKSASPVLACGVAPRKQALASPLAHFFRSHYFRFHFFLRSNLFPSTTQTSSLTVFHLYSFLSLTIIRFLTLQHRSILPHQLRLTDLVCSYFRTLLSSVITTTQRLHLHQAM